MNCAEFQRVLPYIIEAGGNAEEEGHLKSCPVCSDLVQDLRYIADQAKLLVPMHEPSARVWSGLEQSLQREGLVRPTGARGGLLEPNRWGAVPWVAGVAALLLLAVGLMIYRRNDQAAQQQASMAAQPQITSVSTRGGAFTTNDDQQVLAAVAENTPTLRDAYADSLNRVNAYIADAQRALDENPGDQEAWDTLLKAYEQKAMLYEMALARTVY